MLLLRNSYRSRKTFPSGGAKRGESLREAAVREVREEGGISLTLDSLRSVGMFLSTTEYKLDRCEIFEARFDTLPDVHIDGREVIEAEFVSVGELSQRKVTSLVQQYIDNHCPVDTCDDQKGASAT